MLLEYIAGVSAGLALGKLRVFIEPFFPFGRPPNDETIFSHGVHYNPLAYFCQNACFVINDFGLSRFMRFLLFNY